MILRSIQLLITMVLLLFTHLIYATQSDLNGVGSATIKSDNTTDTVKLKEEAENEQSVHNKRDGNLEQTKHKEMEKKAEEGVIEECDPSNRCIDDKNEYVACLRVPGKDSLDLSLLIQNRGEGSLDVNITASDSVSLEKNRVHVRAKDKEEVRVTVADNGNNTTIVLAAGEGGTCNLNFQNTMSASIRKSDTSSQPGLSGHFTLVSSVILVVLFASVLVGLTWSFIKYRRMKQTNYQQLDLGLPISTGGKKDATVSDGWENSWDDNWDDEEAPSKSLLFTSSQGLASRKFNKDTWKD